MENSSRIDVLSLIIFILICVIGISSVYSATSEQGTFTLLEGRSGKQMMWFFVSFFVGGIIFLLNSNFFEIFSWYFYIALVLLLVAVLLVGSEIAGSRSWIKIGSFSLQPAEFAKYGTAFAISAFLSGIDVSLNKRADLIKIAAIIFIPMALIVLQGDAGSSLVFLSFIIVLYREGLTPWVILLGLIAILIFVLTMVIGFTKFSGAIGILYLIFLAFNYSKKKVILPSFLIACVKIRRTGFNFC